MKYLIHIFVIFAITNKNYGIRFSFQTSRRIGATTHATHHEEILNKSDHNNIEDTKQFLANNGYDILNKDIEHTVKYAKFESFKAFSQNKAIQEMIKYII